MRTAFLFLLLTIPAFAAPVPKEATRQKPAELAVGYYSLEWGGSDWVARIGPNVSSVGMGGFFSEYPGDNPRNVYWIGEYEWSADTRLLTVAESPDGGRFWLKWSVVLDDKLAGVNSLGIAVKLTRRK